MIDLRQGDCLEIMKDILNNSIDMILCDLPYGTSAMCMAWFVWDKNYSGEPIIKFI